MWPTSRVFHRTRRYYPDGRNDVGLIRYDSRSNSISAGDMLIKDDKKRVLEYGDVCHLESTKIPVRQYIANMGIQTIPEREFCNWQPKALSDITYDHQPLEPFHASKDLLIGRKHSRNKEAYFKKSRSKVLFDTTPPYCDSSDTYSLDLPESVIQKSQLRDYRPCLTQISDDEAQTLQALQIQELTQTELTTDDYCQTVVKAKSSKHTGHDIKTLSVSNQTSTTVTEKESQTYKIVNTRQSQTFHPVKLNPSFQLIQTSQWQQDKSTGTESLCGYSFGNQCTIIEEFTPYYTLGDLNCIKWINRYLFPVHLDSKSIIPDTKIISATEICVQNSEANVDSLDDFEKS